MAKQLTLIAFLFLSALAVSAQNLYVGVNFHPHDYESMPEIEAQIEMMKDAGFNGCPFINKFFF